MKIIITMTITIEEKMNKDIYWVLTELQSEIMVSKGDIVQFMFVKEEGAPSEREQKRVIKWLKDRVGVIEVLDEIMENYSILNFHPLIKRPVIGYKIKIDRPIFTSLRKIYEDSSENKSANETLELAEDLGKSKRLEIEEVRKQRTDTRPFLNKEKRTVFFKSKQSKIPVGNQWVLCEALFDKPAGSWVKEDDVIRNFNRDGKQSFYDAQRLLNIRIKDDLGIEDFIEYQISMARIKPKTIEKLNNSEK